MALPKFPYPPAFRSSALPICVFCNRDETSEVEHVCDGSWTRRVTGWEPRYEAFDDFIEIDTERFAAVLVAER